MKKNIAIGFLIFAFNTPSFAYTQDTNGYSPQKKEVSGIIVSKSTIMGLNHRYDKKVHVTSLIRMNNQGIGFFNDENGTVFSVTHVFSDFYQSYPEDSI